MQETNSHIKLIEYEDGTTEPDETYCPSETLSNSYLNRQRDSMPAQAPKTTESSSVSKSTSEVVTSKIINRQSLSRDSIGSPSSPKSKDKAGPLTFRIFVKPPPEENGTVSKLFEKTIEQRLEASPQGSLH